MSAKQTFLEQVRDNLRRYPDGDVNDYIEYYDELISERIANGEAESDVLEKIGKPKDIATSFKQNNAIERAVKKPTVSNGLKALIAALSVLSLPFLLPAIGVAIALVSVVAGLFLCGLAVVALGVVAAILSTIDIAAIVFAGDAPVYLLLLTGGATVVIVALAYEVLRGLVFTSRWTTRALIHTLKARQNKKKEDK